MALTPAPQHNEPCACDWRGTTLIRPCLWHYAQLSDWDRHSVRSGLRIDMLTDRREARR